jgi:hypothetical protein
VQQEEIDEGRVEPSERGLDGIERLLVALQLGSDLRGWQRVKSSALRQIPNSSTVTH